MNTTRPEHAVPWLVPPAHLALVAHRPTLRLPAFVRPPTPAEDAAARYALLRSAGKLRGAFATFPACPGEFWRKVETDPDGKVVRYVREGIVRGCHVRVEHLYGRDGALAFATARDLDAFGPAEDASALGVSAPGRAEDATIDADPRCGERG